MCAIGMPGPGPGLVDTILPNYRYSLREYIREVLDLDTLFPSAMAATTLANLHATALTSRSHNPFFRCEQLKSLHDTLRAEINPIRDALRQDQHVTDAEANIEISTALRHLKTQYASIDPKAELESEYRTTKSQDAGDRTDPWGVVYIEPDLRHTPFFSVIEPLGAAVRSGNCIALRVRPQVDFTRELS
jgi:aldehyde dehydrogenase (NAD+)